LRDYTSTPFEIFVAVFTIAPFFVLTYFYPQLPERVPQFLNVRGEVVTWAQTNLLSVFRVPLMAVVTQVVCLLMKYGVVQSMADVPVEIAAEKRILQERFLARSAALWDCFRLAVAFKMSAASLDTIFLSVARLNYLSRPTFVVTATAAFLGVLNALWHGFWLLVLWREMKRRLVDAESRRSVDARRVYGGVFYYNPADATLFVDIYLFNFGNKWAWVFVTSIIAYPVLVFS
jgi:uncharacterized membrane protein